MDDIDSVKDTPEEVYTPPAREEVVGADGSKGRVYVIPSPNLSTFTDKFAKLVKRANKLEITPPSYVELRQVPKVIRETTEEYDELGHPIVVEHVILMHHLAVFHPVVILQGWEFVAKLEHTEEGNILHVLQGKTLPPQYRECEAWCDHCQTKRRRNDTFVLYHAGDNEWIQVGRNCLSDFIGKDAERYANAAELYSIVGQLGEASEEYGGGGDGGQRYEMLDRYLSYVAEVIAQVGWKSRSSAREYGGQATADLALYLMTRRKYDPRDLFRHPTDKSVEIAKAAIQWAEEITDAETEGNDYLHNIRLIARRQVVGYKQFGFAASIVSAYQRHLVQLQAKQRREEKPSNWVGEEGERRLFHLLVEKVIQVGGEFSFPSELHLMSDDVGNRFVWFAHGTSLEVGKWVWLKGTIKKHNERENIRQNILTRCDPVEMNNYLVVYQGQEYAFQATDLKDAKKKLPSVLDVAKAPRGLTITEVISSSTQPEDISTLNNGAHVS